MKIAFLLLCHGNAEVICNLLKLNYFNNSNINVYVHYDKKQSKSSSKQLQDFLSKKENFHFVTNRVDCGWGQYSLVKATLNMMKAALENKSFVPDYLYLISPACHPVKPFAHLTSFLNDNNGQEFIEANDHRYVKWIEGGWDKERTWYYFPFNYMTEREQFQEYCDFQEKYEIKRTLPINLNLHFGSQWFCLTNKTCKKVLEILDDQKLEDYFKLCWIPDEFLIQSLVVKIAGLKKLTNKTLTFYQFNSFGRPLFLCNDHINFVEKLPFFFARKISNNALKLKEKLKETLSNKNNTENKITIDNVGIRPEDFKINRIKYLEWTRETKLGRIKDAWNDGLNKSMKPYFVLTGPCKYLIDKLIEDAPKTEHTIYNYLFNIKKLMPSTSEEPYNGFSKYDINRRNENPVAYLYQVIHSNTTPICFAFDTLDDSEHIREVVRWDENANVLIVAPFWNNNNERMISYLSESEANTVLNLKPKEMPSILQNIVSKKNKFYWMDLKNDNSKHKASIKWLEESESEISTLFSKIKSKYNLNSYLPKANLKLLSMLNENEIVTYF